MDSGQSTVTEPPSRRKACPWLLSSGMDIQVYLDRIGYHGPLAPTAETLRAA